MDADKIIDFFYPENSIKSTFLTLIRLEEKLKTPSGQSFYFEKALANNSKKLHDLIGKCENILHSAAHTSEAEFLEEIKRSEEIIRRFQESQGGRLVRDITINSSTAKIQQYREFIHFKQRFPVIKSLREMLADDDFRAWLESQDEN